MNLVKVMCSVAMVVALGACAAFEESGKAIGTAADDITTAIGHGTRDAVKAIGNDTEELMTGDGEEAAE